MPAKTAPKWSREDEGWVASYRTMLGQVFYLGEGKDHLAGYYFFDDGDADAPKGPFKHRHGALKAAEPAQATARKAAAQGYPR